MIEQWMNPAVIQRMAGSLLHFFWQGAVLAIAVSISLRLLSRKSAETRYVVSVVALFLMLAAPIVTFLFYAETGQIALRAIRFIGESFEPSGSRSLRSLETAAWAQWIVLVWCGGVAICAIRLMASWKLSQRLKRSAVASVPAPVVKMFEQVREQLARGKRVALLLSEYIDTPVVVGWLRPIVLLPVTVITGLNEDQLLAVLAHELAHVRRHDFLVNMLQSGVESILFYHPAVWWLSARIRRERENCCDDLAVRVCGDRLLYAQALVELERHRAVVPALALAATGNDLSGRVRRILGRESGNRDWQPAAAALAFVLVWILAGVWQSSMLNASTMMPPTLRAAAVLPAAPQPSVSMAGAVQSIAAIVTAQPVPPEPQGLPDSGIGIVQGMVTREGTSDPIPDVQITLFGKGYGRPPVSSFQDVDALLNLNRDLILGELNRAVQNGTVTVIPTLSEPMPFTAVTDGSGHFSVANVPVGVANVSAQLKGYFGKGGNGNYPSVATNSVAVVSGKTSDVRISMTPGGNISGRITDSNGKPASDIQVQILQWGYTDGHAALQLQDSKNTDDRGEYRAFGLSPGEYVVAAIALAPPTGGRRTNSGVPVKTFYPGVTDQTRAQAILIRPGEDRTGTNMSMSTATLVTVSGKVTSGLPPASAPTGANRSAATTVTIAQQTPDPVRDLSRIASVAANPDGTFQIPEIPPGTYDLFARMPVAYGWGPSFPPERAIAAWAIGRSTVVVKDSRIDNANINVFPGIDVKGSVTVDGNPSAPSLLFYLVVDDALASAPDGQLINIVNQIRRYPIRIDQDGSFTYPALPPARYRFTALLGAAAAAVASVTAGARGQAVAPVSTPVPATPLPPNAYLADIRQGGISVYDSGIVIGTQTSMPLEVLVKTDGGRIDGNVIGPDRKPVASGITVVLIPPEGRRQNSELYKSARTDADGHFVMGAIPPGRYTLLAWGNIRPGAYQNPEFLKQYLDRGVAVTVVPNSKDIREVTLIP